MREGLWPVGHLLAACHLWDPIDLMEGFLSRQTTIRSTFLCPFFPGARQDIRVIFFTRRHLQSCAPVGCCVVGARDTYMYRTSNKLGPPAAILYSGFSDPVCRNKPVFILCPPVFGNAPNEPEYSLCFVSSFEI